MPPRRSTRPRTPRAEGRGPRAQGRGPGSSPLDRPPFPRPRPEAALEVDDVLDPRALEDARRDRRARSALAVDDQRALGRELADARGELAERDVRRAGHV